MNRDTDISHIEKVEDGEEIHNLKIEGDGLVCGLVRQQLEDNSLVKDTTKYRMFSKVDDIRLEEHLSTQTQEEDVSKIKEIILEENRQYLDPDSSSVEDRKQLDTHTSFNHRENEVFGESNVKTASIQSNGALTQENDLMIEELTVTLVDKFTEGGQHVQISFQQSRIIRKVKKALTTRKQLEVEKDMKEIVQ